MAQLRIARAAEAFALFYGLTHACFGLTSPPRTDYVSYLGGSKAESIAGIAVDAAGSAYVAGTTNSPDFPLTSTALGAPVATSSCAFVTKFNPAGTGIVFSICLHDSRALAFGLDGSGNMYLALLPSGLGAALSSVVKLDPSGQHILYSTPLEALAESMAVDAAGNVYVTGSASTEFTPTAGAYQQRLAAGTCWAGAGVQLEQVACPDAFAMKIGTSGAVAWATYLGGSRPDDAHAIAIDRAGNVWVAGETVSSDFPTTPGAVSSTFSGEVDLGPLKYGDAFVAKFDPTGGKLLFSTYLGGSAPDGAFALAVDRSGSAYVAGGTQSLNFPTTAGALQPVYTGGSATTFGLNGNAFVTKFDESGRVVYSTFVGAPHRIGTAITVDSAGQVYVNTAPQVPTAACAKPPALSVLNAAGSAIVASSPVGGAYLALDNAAGLYTVGTTGTLAFFATPYAYQTQYGGGDSDSFVAKVDFSQPEASQIFSVVNAANLFPGYVSNYPTGAVAPGEVVTLFGSGFGAQPTVLFDGVPAPVLYASQCQINTVVRFEAASELTTLVEVQDGQTTASIRLPVVPAAPGIFTMNGTGAGQAAILNGDGTPNSSSNPATRGSIVSIFMTGTGAETPFLGDGLPGPLSPPFPAPITGIGVRIGAATAPVLFAGQAPGLIAGVTQVNVLIPQDAPTGDSVLVTVFAGGYVSQFQLSGSFPTPPVVMAVR